MRRFALRFVVLAACCVAAGPVGAQDAGSFTVWDGIYTGAQAERGRAAYTQACAACHGEDLRGRETAPSLVEESFAFLWRDMTVGDLFERTRLRMPSDRPNSLPGQTYADIIAFILQKNAYRTGPRELAADVESLKRIRIIDRP
jgi:mono/diheme cytochrome c family protein